MISPISFNKTDADLIRNLIEAYTFLDFGTVYKVNDKSSVDINLGASPSPVIITDIELLSFGGASLKITSMPKKDDVVLVFTPRTYIEDLANLGNRTKVSKLKYQLANCKAVLFVPASNKVDVELYAEEGELELTCKKFVVTSDAVEVNGAGDAVVLHSQLSTILNNFVTQLNTALGTKLNGGGSVGTFVIDLTPAKSVSLKVGS